MATAETQAIIDLLNSVTSKRVRALTPDYGTEFANYQDTINTLEIPLFSQTHTLN
ncbi:transposase [Lactiplantibacillus plantarum CMPG5300]|uniref:Transposase n=2 Tax=Lactiplantibacillus plantarum TaxID=1590 RepID=F9UN06_LACPL|nr:transposase [Lactiplantibacillus plantarum CMPG5300]CCC78595.1 transposase, fragment [Lactiplantibacillus plantarum WCFS1]